LQFWVKYSLDYASRPVTALLCEQGRLCAISRGGFVDATWREREQ
jgi:hypothetical protein